MSFVAVAIGGSAVIGGATSIIAGNKAAGAARDAAQAQAATDKYIFDQTRQDNAPWKTVGVGALGKLAKLYGIDTGETSGGFGASPDYMGYYNANPDLGQAFSGNVANYQGRFGNPEEFAKWHWGEYGQREGRALPTTGGVKTDTSSAPYGGFYESPGYRFRLDEGLKAIERSAAARGGRFGGATMKALNDYAGNSASDEVQRYTGNLFQLAGFGTSANQSNQQAGQTYAGNMAATNANLGNARASAYANTGNAINQGVSNVASAYLYQNAFNKMYPGGGKL